MPRFALAFLLAVLALLAPSTLHAHTKLTRSEPAAGSTLTASPAEMRLWFQGGIEAAFTRVRLRTANGVQIAVGAPVRGAERGQLVVPVPVTLHPDRYVVEWETVGRDGHPIRGEFQFTMGGTPAPTTTAPAAIDSSAFGAGAPGRTATGPPVGGHPVGMHGDSTGAVEHPPLTRPVRWLELAALVLAIGAVAVLLVVVPAVARSTTLPPAFAIAAAARVATAAGIAALVFLAMTVWRLTLESQLMHRGGDALTGDALGRVIATVWGRGWLVGFGAATTLLLALFAVRLRSPGARAMLALAALMLAIAPALTGHAFGSADHTVPAVIADWVHVVGAAAWIGGVMVIAVAAAPVALAQEPVHRPLAAAALIDGFHRLATPGLALVVGSGIVSTWIRVGSWSALTASNYGSLLLFKIFAAGIAAMLGAYHWKRARPRLLTAAVGDERETRKVRTTLYLELLVGLVILALTSALVSTPSPR